MNRRSLLSLAASTGLLCGARRDDHGTAMRAFQSNWHVGPEYTSDWQLTGLNQVVASASFRQGNGVLLVNGDLPAMEWPTGIVARSLLANNCLPPVPAGMRRANVKISVSDSNIGFDVKFVHCTYVELPI